MVLSDKSFQATVIIVLWSCLKICNGLSLYSSRFQGEVRQVKIQVDSRGHEKNNIWNTFVLL